MNETLVYDAARDAAIGLSITAIATACIVAGFVLMAVPTMLTMRRQPDKRRRGLATLATLAALAVGVVIGFRILDTVTGGARPDETIEGVVGAVSPTLFTVGGMKVMVSCADTARCPGVAPGDYARVGYVEDSGPETDALATHIWKRTR